MVPAEGAAGRSALLVLVLPLALAIAGYWPALSGDLVFDDAHLVERNPAIKTFDAFAAQPRLLAPNSRAVTDLTLALNYRLGRLEPLGYHLVNLALHLAVVLLVHRLARLLLRRARLPAPEWTALAVAGLFALHPLQTQAVAYVSQRSEILASLFYVATLLLLFAVDVAGNSLRRIALAAAALACFLLALYSKAIAVTLPVAWLLLAWAFPEADEEPVAPRVRRTAALAAPFLVISILFAWSSVAATAGGTDGGFDLPFLTPRDYTFTQAHVLWTYVRLLLLPFGQSVDHDYPISRHLDAPTALAGLGVVAAILVSVATLARRPADGRGGAGRTAAAGVLWFLVLLAPTSSFVPLVDVIEEHRIYLASFGLFLALGAVGARLLSRLGERAALPAAATVLLLWGAETTALRARAAVWVSSLTLWSDAAAKAPTKVRPHANLGYALERAGMLDSAVASYQLAAALPPSPVTRRQDVLRNLGSTLAKLGRIPDAASALVGALALEPGNAEVLTNLAICELELGHPQRAAALAKQALVAAPTLGNAHVTLGEALLQLGDAEGALRSFERGAELDPDVAVRHYDVAIAQARLDRPREACEAARRAALAARLPSEAAMARELEQQLGCGRR